MATSKQYVIDLSRDKGEMDGDNDKVFVSKISRSGTSLHNNFYDIIKKDVVQPNKPTLKNEVQNECEFKPRDNKYYVPKKKTKLKVFTIRDIRNYYEKYIFETLPCELERQQKFLLRKIREGYFNDENTRNVALNVFKSDKPLSRTSWQMLMNLNPNSHIHSSQYILWNGKRIQITGSKGGKNKYICNYDVNNDEESLRKVRETKRKVQKKRALLRDSLDIRFKPGPLQKKKDLDDSYQKYNVGEIKLVNLPEIGLHIYSSYGTALDPTMTTFLQNMRAIDGTISEKWAEFAGSVLGKVTEEGTKIEAESSVIFNLKYKYDQKRILMRNDLIKSQNADNDTACCPTDEPLVRFNDDLLTHDIKDIINRMLDSVEISLNQNSMYSGEDEPREFLNHKDLCNISGHNQIKEKEKKRKYGELDRLDVTVIRISENNKRNNAEPCQQLFCSLGCVCDSLECAYQIKDHCSRVECMFGCSCDFSKFKLANSLEGNCSEFIPGLFYLDKKINDKLTKEEQKFHQTVIVTDDKSILLKSRRRNWKTSKKYADFYSSMPLRTDIVNQKIPIITISKLKCDNIEPWCMVHNLYKCFCKGKFVQSIIYDSSDVDTILNIDQKDREIGSVKEKTQITRDNYESIESDTQTNVIGSDTDLSDSLCVRTLPFHSRKYSDGYYSRTNKKILEMEKNDKKLHTKMMTLINGIEGNEKTDETETQNVFLDITDIELENNESNKSNKSCDTTIIFDSSTESFDSVCARALPFEGRKYSDGYYRRKNEKIFGWEKKDKTLHARMLSLISSAEENNQKVVTQTQDKIFDVINAFPYVDELPINTFHEKERLVNASASVSNIEKKKSPPNKNKLVKWLESNLTKDFLESVEKGSWTTSLSRPSVGKVALYPWQFILSRYRERKNLFLLSTQKPFRIYMAVDSHNSYFENCINVSDIPISSVGEYPEMVRNLICHASHDNFCILSGLAMCWELVGSVNKVNKNDEIKTAPNCINDDIFHKDESSNDEPKCVNSSIISDTIIRMDYGGNDTAEISKWLIMTIENDFDEVRFMKKGFFVKYDSIIRSINVARKLRKTVRLSSQRCNEGSSGPRFGIYVTPDLMANTLFIGPYEEHELPGIDITRNSLETLGGKKTKGVWITVNKTDNLRVTDNPLLFLPSHKNNDDSVITLDSDTDTDSEVTKKTEISSSPDNTDLSDEKSSLHSSTNKARTIKLVKPIRIRKTDSFYHLGSQNALKHYAFTKCLQQINEVQELNKIPPLGSSSLNNVSIKPLEMTQLETFQMESKSPFNKPISEIAPQIKINNISALCSNSFSTESTSYKKKSEGMFVLKPEEINKRVVNNYFRIMEPIESGNNNSDEIWPKIEKKYDVEEFLDSSAICAAPASDVYVISDDDEDDDGTIRSSECVWKNVWIMCTNIPNIGWISGRRNNENKLSFEFPGFDYTDYYDETEAFDKINEVFSKKVYVPQNIQAKWRVIEIENEESLDIKNKLLEEDLGIDFVLTSRGLIHKEKLVSADEKNKEDKHNDELGSSSEGCMEVEQMYGSEKIINTENLSNDDSIQGNITAVASTSIDADGNDQGIMVYRMDSTDLQEEITNKQSCNE